MLYIMLLARHQFVVITMTICITWDGKDIYIYVTMYYVVYISMECAYVSVFTF